MSHIIDQMASWETPASEHTDGRETEFKQRGGSLGDVEKHVILSVLTGQVRPVTECV